VTQDSTVTIIARSDWPEGNLDLDLQLLQPDGTVIAQADNSDIDTEFVSSTLIAGSYYIRIESVGGTGYSDYASLGQYYITIISADVGVTFTDDFDVSAGPRVNPGWSTDPAILPGDAWDPSGFLAAATGNPGMANGVADLATSTAWAWQTTAPQNSALGNEQVVTVEVDAIFSSDLTEINFGSGSPIGIWGGDSIRIGLRRDNNWTGASSIWFFTSLGGDPDVDYVSAPGLFGITDWNWHNIKVEFDGIGDDTLKIWVDGTQYLDMDLATYAGGAANNRINLNYTGLLTNVQGGDWGLGFFDNLVISNTVSGASSPDPVNGDTTCYISDIVLSWVPDVDASSHDVYFDTNPNPTTLLQSGVAVVEPRTSVNAPTPLVAGTTYYWRVDTNAPNLNTIGSVWSFTMEDPYCYCGQPGQVYNPMDFDTNCTVDFLDFAAFGAQWLKCTDPADQLNCDSWNGL
jgi:hypothetical protein